MRTRTLLLTVAILAQSMLLAQDQVSVMPVITPPYSIYISDYQGTLMVNLTNQTTETLELKLIGSLTADNGYSARTNSNYSPPSPIQLGPLQTTVLYANSPELSFIDQHNLQINAPQQIQNAVMQTGILPEGNYELCIQAVDYYTGVDLSPEAPIGCIFFNISNVQPPMLTFPWCDSTVDTEWPVFTWSPPIGNISMTQVQYDLYILELLPGQNPTDAMWLAIDGIAGNPIVRRDLMIPAYPWQPYDPSLKTNTTYAVAVVARDLSNSVTMENKGRSEVCTFMIDPLQIGVEPITFNPLAPITDLTTGLILANPRNTHIRGRLVYQFKESVEGCADPDQVQEGAQPSTVQVSNGQLPPGMGPRLIGEVGIASGTSNATSWNGYSGITESSMGAYSFSSGHPQNTILNTSPAFTAYVPPGMPDTLPPNYKWREPSRVSTAGGKPIKRVQVRLVERILLIGAFVKDEHGNVITSDRVIYGVDPLPGGDQYEGVNGVEKKWIHGNPIDWAWTNEDGSFEFRYQQSEYTGVDIGMAGDQSMPVGQINIGNTGKTSFDSYTLTVGAASSQKVLMIEVVSPYYCSPTLEIYAQPGDDIDLPEQACYVHSYNLEVQAKRGNCNYQTGASGSVLGNVEVEVMRTQGHTPLEIPSSEGQDTDELVAVGGHGNVPLVSRCKTKTSDGTALFTNLVSHDGSKPDDYLMRCSTSKDGGLYNFHTAQTFYPDVETIRYGDEDRGPVSRVHQYAGHYRNPVFNKDFEVKTYKLSVKMMPDMPRVIGRVMVSAVQSLPNAKVQLELRYDKAKPGESAVVIQGCSNSHVGDAAAQGTTLWRTVYTDENGYFVFSDILIKGSDQNSFLGPHARIHVSKPGYEPASRPLERRKRGGPPPPQPAPGEERTMSLKMGTQWDMTSGILLEAYGLVEGIVRDEYGNAVKCDVQVGDGPWGRTKSSYRFGDPAIPTGSAGLLQPNYAPGVAIEKFTVPAPSSAGSGTRTVRLLPLSDQYFPYEVNMTIGKNPPNAPPQDLGTFIVKEKKHRLRVLLFEEFYGRIDGVLQGKPAKNAKIHLGEMTLTSDANGQAYFDFRTPATEFRLRIKPKQNFLPVDTLIINRVTPEEVTMLIILKKGKQLDGTVIDDVGDPIAGARVWVEMGADKYGPQLNETSSNSQGKFVLHGVPEGEYTVYAAKYDPQISYIGTSKTIGGLSWQNTPPLTIPAPVPPPAPGRPRRSPRNDNPPGGGITPRGSNTPRGGITPAGGNTPVVTILTPDPIPLLPSGQTVTLILSRELDMDLSSIYGFPVEVNHRTKNADGTYTLKGAFVKLPRNDNFRMAEDAQRIPFSNVNVTAGTPNAKGIPHAEPVDGLVNTDQTYLPLRLYADLNVTLNGADDPAVRIGRPRIHQTIVIQNSEAGGEIRGRVNSELSTFNFSYSFSGVFYLGSSSEQPLIDVFRSSSAYPQRSFNLMTLRENRPGDAEFLLRDFAARSDRKNSFVEPDVFRIATVLRIKDIPDITPSVMELAVGEVRVYKDTIEGIRGGGEKLSFQLHKWSFESSGPWHFNSGLASIVIPKGTLNMVGATAEVKQILIRPNSLDMDVMNLSEVRMGGVAPVKPKDAKWFFGYDPGYIFRGDTGVWRLGVLSTRDCVATIQGPMELVPSELQLSSFSLLSRGPVLAEVRPVEYRYFNIMDMTPIGTFQTTPDGVDMHMTCSMAINGMRATTGLFSFFNKNGSLESRLQPLDTYIETGSAGVWFSLDTRSLGQVISDGRFRSYGNFLIPPAPGETASSTTLKLRGFLDHTAGSTKIELIQVDENIAYKGTNRQAIKFGGSNTKKMLLDSGMQVMRTPGNGWEELGFKGTLVGMESMADHPSNELTFLVKGSVVLDKGTVSVDQLSTAFGKLSMTYEFEKARMTGNLTIEKCNFAAVYIDYAQLGFVADPGGFLIHCTGADVTVTAAPPPFRNYRVNFMIGSHDDIPTGITTAISKGMRIQTLPEHLVKGKILGMYLHGGMDWINIKVPTINLLLFSVSGELLCGAEARMWVDMGAGDMKFGMGGMLYAKAALDLAVLPCTAGFSTEVEVGFLAELKNEVFTISGCAGVKVGGSFCFIEDHYWLTMKATAGTDGKLTFEQIDGSCGDN